MALTRRKPKSVDESRQEIAHRGYADADASSDEREEPAFRIFQGYPDLFRFDFCSDGIVSYHDG